MKRIHSVMILLVALAISHSAVAESVRRSGGDSGASMQQLQQLAVERDALQAKTAQLEADNAKISKELEKFKAKLEANEREAASLKRKMSDGEQAAQEQQVSYANKLKDTEDRLRKVVDKYKELVEQLRKSEEQGVALQANLGQQGELLAQCTKDNQALYQTSLDLLQRYEEKGVWDAVMQHEPVTQLKRVEIESIGETYRDRAEQHKFMPQADASAQ